MPTMAIVSLSCDSCRNLKQNQRERRRRRRRRNKSSDGTACFYSCLVHTLFRLYCEAGTRGHLAGLPARCREGSVWRTAGLNAGYAYAGTGPEHPQSALRGARPQAPDPHRRAAGWSWRRRTVRGMSMRMLPRPRGHRRRRQSRPTRARQSAGSEGGRQYYPGRAYAGAPPGIFVAAGLPARPARCASAVRCNWHPTPAAAAAPAGAPCP